MAGKSLFYNNEDKKGVLPSHPYPAKRREKAWFAKFFLLV